MLFDNIGRFFIFVLQTLENKFWINVEKKLIKHFAKRNVSVFKGIIIQEKYFPF